MMLTFKNAGEYLKIKIWNNEVYFADMSSNLQTFYPIEFLRMTKEGILKEHPDLSNESFEKMKKEAAQRLRLYLKNLGSEERIKEYIIIEMEKIGYILKFIDKEEVRK